MQRRRVAILGAGNGGRTAAVELGLRGHDVTIFGRPDFGDRLKVIEERGGIRSTGVIEGDAPVRVTTDLASAVDDKDLILIVVPTNYQREYSRLLAPLVTDGMTIGLMPGSFGSLEFVADLRNRGATADITVCEFAALPYATRITGPDEVHVFGRRSFVSAGVFPSRLSDTVAPLLTDLYPDLRMMANVIEAGLNNPNPTLHCLGVLLSASRIEYSHGDFYYYEEGMTPSVCRAIEAIDAERQAIGAALDVDVMSLIDTYPDVGYGPRGTTFWSVIRGVEALHGIKGPGELDSRYLTEDVPIGLTIYSQLGRAMGAPAPLMESVITIAGALLSRDFADAGRTLQRCGIDGLDRGQLQEYVTNGVRPE